MPDSALLIRVPQAEPLVSEWRREFDGSAEVIPHLTLAEIEDEQVLASIASELASGFHVHVDVDEATLMTQQASGFWRVAETFALGAR